MRRLVGVFAAVAALSVSVSLVPIAGAGGDLAPTAVARVWTEPAAGYGFLDSAVDQARHSIEISMYELSDSILEHDLVAKARAGVVVRVVLNADYEGRDDNAAAANVLTSGGVRVIWAPSDTIFHAKYVVIDNDAAYVGTGNLVTEDYASTRDFWVEDTNARVVAAISATFASDFARRDAQPDNAPGLVWSPGSTSALVALISSAKNTLLVENEEMDDATIEQALQTAARRGVDVKVVMTSDSHWASALSRLERAGVHVATLSASQIYIHAKVICADCTTSSGTVFVGSENFSVSSLVYNRELGVVTTTPSVVRAVESALNADYAVGSVRS